MGSAVGARNTERPTSGDGAGGQTAWVHVNVTRHPTDAWIDQQLREATRMVKKLHPREKYAENEYVNLTGLRVRFS